VLLGLSARARGLDTIQPAVLWISDRLIVFLFLLLPMFLVCSLYVIYRNIT
jgi:zona occludens toxin (predicted ATPase)